MRVEEDLYRDVILDHYRDPRYEAALENPDAKAEGVNRVCGDELLLTLRFENGIVTEVGAEGKGCSISMASASMLAEAITGKPLAEVQGIIDQVTAMLTDKPHDPMDEGEDLAALSGVKNYPVRIKCALLPWATLQQALSNPEEAATTE